MIKIGEYFFRLFLFSYRILHIMNFVILIHNKLSLRFIIANTKKRKKNSNLDKTHAKTHLLKKLQIV